MSFGASITNDNGTTIIDENYINLHIRTSGTMFNIFQSNNVSLINVNYTNNGTLPLIALQYPRVGNRLDAGVGLIATSRSGNAWTFTVLCFYDPNLGVPNTYFNYYIVDVPLIPPGSQGFGMRVWNGAGTMVFTTDDRPMIIYNYGQDNSAPTGNWAAFATGAATFEEDVEGVPSSITGPPPRITKNTWQGFCTTPNGCVSTIYRLSSTGGSPPPDYFYSNVQTNTLVFAV